MGEIGSTEDGLAFSGGALEVEDSGPGGISEGEGGNIFLKLSLAFNFPRLSYVKITGFKTPQNLR